MNQLPPPKELLALAHRELGPLAAEVVFVGGAVISILAEQLAPDKARPTEDVDVVIEAATKADYDSFDASLRRRGFLNDFFGPICRYRKGLLVLDVVPTKGEILGFANEWYQEGCQKAHKVSLSADSEISVIFPPCMVASKFSAFNSPHREGYGDLLASRDFADIVTMLAYRLDLAEEVKAGSHELQSCLKECFRELLERRGVEEGVASALDPDLESQLRRSFVLDRMRLFAGQTT